MSDKIKRIIFIVIIVLLIFSFVLPLSGGY